MYRVPGKAYEVDFEICHNWLQQQCFPSQGGSCPLQQVQRPAGDWAIWRDRPGRTKGASSRYYGASDSQGVKHGDVRSVMLVYRTVDCESTLSFSFSFSLSFLYLGVG